MSDTKKLPDSIASMSRTDEEIAADLKARVDKALTPMLELMNEANSMGFYLSWQAILPTIPDRKNRMIELTATRVKVY